MRSRGTPGPPTCRRVARGPRRAGTRSQSVSTPAHAATRALTLWPPVMAPSLGSAAGSPAPPRGGTGRRHPLAPSPDRRVSISRSSEHVVAERQESKPTPSRSSARSHRLRRPVRSSAASADARGPHGGIPDRLRGEGHRLAPHHAQPGQLGVPAVDEVERDAPRRSGSRRRPARCSRRHTPSGRRARCRRPA